MDTTLPLMTTTDAARSLGMSVGTLVAWRGNGTGPRYVRCGRSVRYRASDLAEYVGTNVVAPRAA